MNKNYDIIIPMRILILGNNYTVKELYNSLCKNKNNIVFSTHSEVKNSIGYEDKNEIIDFCEANEINLVIICDENYIHQEFLENLNALNITIFSPSSDAINICKHKSYAKKFINKNRFLAPKFFIAEKPSSAVEYIESANYPLAIRPDIHSYRECTKFCETFSKAQKIVYDFFENGNKKIIIEDYIEGKNVVIWTLCDGYRAEIIGSNAKYQNNVGLFEPDFLTNELKEKITNEIINPAVLSLAQQEEEYIGILGFDFIINSKNEPYLVGFNSFFDDISIKFFTKCYDINWADVFESCVIGDVFSKYEFKAKDDWAIVLRQNEDIKFLSARTKSNLERYLDELEFDTTEFKEASKLWKY